MKRAAILGWLAAGALALSLAGCDPRRISELEEGVATEADVRARFGEPEQIWLPRDGRPAKCRRGHSARGAHL